MSESEDIRNILFEPQPRICLDRRETALLIIDMQYYDAHPDYGSCLRARQAGCEEGIRYYLDGLTRIVPKIRRLQDVFRAKGMEVIHTRIASLTQDGRDRSRQHKNAGIHVLADSKEAEILEELRPIGDEVVLSKTASGAFFSTNIDYVLRNLGIKQLVVVGVVTHGCVEAVVREAVAHNYAVVLVEDGCTAWTEELHTNALRALGARLANVRSADDVIREVKGLK